MLYTGLIIGQPLPLMEKGVPNLKKRYCRLYWEFMTPISLTWFDSITETGVEVLTASTRKN